jgi:adenine-specific DNA-methyltransferase
MSVDPDEPAIALDFFAGSGTTGQAAFEFNAEKDADVRWLQIQLPEPIEDGTEASEAGFETISEIGVERTRRAGEKLSDESEEQSDLLDETSDVDVGFKVFQLDESNFQSWEGESIGDADDLAEQMKMFDTGLKDDVEEEDVLYELILREGLSLNAKVSQLDVDANTVFRIVDDDKEAGASFYACLDETVDGSTPDALELDKEDVFICLDSALDDSLKVNLDLQCILKVI